MRAEIASSPLTNIWSFTHPIVELDPDLEEGSRTEGLWRECERMLVQNGAGWSLDRLVALRDSTWFQGSVESLPQPAVAIPMHEYLRHLARSHLEPRSGTTEVFQPLEANPMDAVSRYRWLTFALPEDLLLTAIEVERPPDRVDIDPPLLVRRLLDRGVAELHLHGGAGMDYSLLWTAALGALATPTLRELGLWGPGAPFDDGKKLIDWLLAAAIARVVLAEYLLRRETCTEAPASLGGFIEKVVEGPWWHYRRRVLRAALEALARGAWLDDDEPPFPSLRDLYGDLHPSAAELTEDCPTTLADVWRRCDPIAVRLSLSGPDAGERFLVARSLTYLASPEGMEDELFAQLFWQTMRVRCQHYRAVVQRPMTAGLQWFVRFYARIAALRDPLRSVRAEAAYWTSGRGHAIAAIELRASLGDTPSDVAKELLDCVESWQHVLDSRATRERPPEVGVIFHFVKERDPEHRWTHGTPRAFWRGTHAEPRSALQPGIDLTSEGRFVDLFAFQARKARAIEGLLLDLPEALWLVRGIDVASDELAVPTWVMVPLYRCVQDAADRASARAHPDGPPSLRLTAHVGEDHRHLMEGLRRVFECVNYMLLQTSGGRLGHATALGIEPRWWAESGGAVTVPFEERLMDLIFEWRLYTRYRVRTEFGACAPPARPEQVANQIRKLSEYVFGRSFEPERLAELHHVLHRFMIPPLHSLSLDGAFDTFSRALRSARARPPKEDEERVNFSRDVWELLERYLEDEMVFRRGQELLDVAIDTNEVEALSAVQQALRCGVATNGVVVEVNPSSNLLIGDMLDLRNHPMLRLYPIEPDPQLVPVAITVGSDDPVTFSTSLIREYTLLYEAGRAAGYADRQVLDWLEVVRRTSMDARFTLGWRPSAMDQARSLAESLRRYLQEP